MKQLSLNVMTMEEAQKRIFSPDMKEYRRGAAHNDYDFEKRCKKAIQEVVNSGLDLAHIDEYPNPPTRQPYQWFMDLVLWPNIIWKTEDSEGYPHWTTRVDEFHFEKLKQLSTIVKFDRKFSSDGQERWPDISNKNASLPDLERVGGSLDLALLNGRIIEAACYLMVGRRVIAILDRYLDPSHTTQDEVAQRLSDVLSHSSYQSYGDEPFQKGYALNELLEMAKKHYPGLRSEDVKPKVPWKINARWAVWQEPAFAKAKQILDSEPQLEASTDAPKAKKKP